MAQKLKVLFVSSEIEPFAKTGGLADVSSALPKAIRKQNCDVHLMMPYYSSVVGKIEDFTVNTMSFSLRLGNTDHTAEFIEANTGLKRNGVPITFVKCDALFSRDGLYGDSKGDYPDNLLRFSFFCHIVLHYANQMPQKPDIIHCNDWQTGLIPALIEAHPDLFGELNSAARIMTIHNLSFQGVFPSENFPITGLPERFNRMDALEYYGKFSLLKAGVLYSDWVTTVSEKYCEEIQTKEHGSGFENILKNKSGRLVGILNGIDESVWNPERDRFIAGRYSAQDLSKKELCREDLLESVGLDPDSKAPILAMVTRLTEQKGCELVLEIADALLAEDVKLVVLGAGDKRFEERFLALAARYPDKVAVRIEYNDALAHKIEAGADLFLMPSRFEPSGLNQMYSLKYGTIPIVRATGGLDDTIMNYSMSTKLGNGFKFHEYTGAALLDKIRQALDLLRNHPDDWTELMIKAMSEDHSWKSSAQRYVNLYREALRELSHSPRKPKS